MRFLAFVLLFVPTLLAAQGKPRARDLGIPIGGTPGRWDAITDVAGVEVGQTTLISGSGKAVVGRGPVRTGVTAILPRGKGSSDPVMAGWFSLNGNGEMTGTTWVEESGFLWGPVVMTNTLSVGVVRDAVIEWSMGRKYQAYFLPLWALPVVGEVDDSGLNDAEGFHVHKEDAFRALDRAASGPVAEGGVGGGTGAICYEFKGGIGTASRKLEASDGSYTVGVLVQCNHGIRRRLTVAGVPVGKEIPDLLPCRASGFPPTQQWLLDEPRCETPGALRSGPPRREAGSIIVAVATDAPLLPHQLKALAKRVSLGLGRMGALGGDSSGEIFIAFSTANPSAGADTGVTSLTILANSRLDPLFEATIQATEEAVLNAMLAAETMTGADDYRVYALPTDRLMEVMKKYGRAE